MAKISRLRNKCLLKTGHSPSIYSTAPCSPSLLSMAGPQSGLADFWPPGIEDHDPDLSVTSPLSQAASVVCGCMGEDGVHNCGLPTAIVSGKN